MLRDRKARYKCPERHHGSQTDRYLQECLPRCDRIEIVLYLTANGYDIGHGSSVKLTVESTHY